MMTEKWLDLTVCSCIFFFFKVPLPPNGQMPSYGLLPAAQFPPMAQPVIQPSPQVQQSFQPSFPAPSEQHIHKTHPQVSGS